MDQTQRAGLRNASSAPIKAPGTLRWALGLINERSLAMTLGRPIKRGGFTGLGCNDISNNTDEVLVVPRFTESLARARYIHLYAFHVGTTYLGRGRAFALMFCRPIHIGGQAEPAVQVLLILRPHQRRRTSSTSSRLFARTPQMCRGAWRSPRGFSAYHVWASIKPFRGR